MHRNIAFVWMFILNIFRNYMCLNRRQITERNNSLKRENGIFRIVLIHFLLQHITGYDNIKEAKSGFTEPIQ